MQTPSETATATTTATTAAVDWPALALDQLDWHWREHLRPRLDGITDGEYHWEPVPGCWGVRPRGTSTAPVQAGDGDWTVDFAVPEPDPAPVTTIAWRLAHLVVGVFGARVAAQFGGPPTDYPTHVYAGTAADGLAQLDDAYARWRDGVASLDAAGMARPVGPAEGPWAEHPMAELVLHIHREAIHHGAEVALLRDLYRWQRR